MSNIFDTFDVDLDSVSFQYTASRVKEHVFVDRPDGIGVTQWTDFWESVKELYDGEPSPNEAELLETVKELEGQVSSLENDVSELENDNDDLRSEVQNLALANEILVEENDRLEERIAELEK